MPTRCNRWFLLQILLLAQHVSGTIMPIIRSSRVLYKWLLPVVFGAWFSSCRYGVELRVVCPVCGQCCECCVLSGRGLCDELITRLEESYRLRCVVVCDLETSWMRRPWSTGRCRAKNKHKPNAQTGLETRPAFYSVSTLSRVKRRDVMFTIHLRLQPRLRWMEVYLFSPYSPSWRGEGQLSASCHILPISLQTKKVCRNKYVGPS